MITDVKKIHAVRRAIDSSGLITDLKTYQATVVSFQLIGLDMIGTDIEIVASYNDKALFSRSLKQSLDRFSSVTVNSGEQQIVARCFHQGFFFEICGTPIPVQDQLAYLHFDILNRLISMASPVFVRQIQDLLAEDHTVESAVVHYFGLLGDHSEAVQGLRKCSDVHLARMLKARGSASE